MTVKLSNRQKVTIMILLSLLVCAAYVLIGLAFGTPRLLQYQLDRRIPKLVIMAVTAASIGGASIVFQTIINNTIVTPCLLGMDTLYTLIHTAVYFVVGSSSVLVLNENLAFLVDLVIMGLVATLIYSHLFQKTGHNILYVLLIGTVLPPFSAASRRP